MNKLIRRLTAGVTALCMAGSLGVMSAFAAPEALAEGDYVAKMQVLELQSSQPSMSSPIFDHDVDAAVRDGSTRLTLYAVYPMPEGSPIATSPEGTVQNVRLTLGDVQYTAQSDLVSQPLRHFDEAAFGIQPGDYSAQVLTFTLPGNALEALTQPVQVTAFTGAMGMDVTFRIQLSDIQAAAPRADETSTGSAMITADVAAPAASYTVRIPDCIALGTLYDDQATSSSYDVEVTAENLGSGYVQISTAAEGLLHNGDHALAYTNSFGTQKTGVSADLQGTISIAAEAVQAAVSGNYTGTTIFDIAYFAAK